MQNTIRNLINDVHKNFMYREWCALNNAELDITHYEDLLQQEYYLLKYYPAYLAEYYVMYSELLKMYEKESMNIISIGCGSGIDYDALTLALIENKSSISYLGIDIIDWSYKPDFAFEQIDIGRLNEMHFNNIDVIVLPKILIELDYGQIQTLANTIVNSNLSHELYFLNSYITQNSHDGAAGREEFSIICQTLLSNGYIIEGENSCIQYNYFEKHAGIRAHVPSFVYPNDVKNFLITLKSKCVQYDESKIECFQCNIGENPMMNSNYIAFSVIKFVKNDN